MHQAAAAGGDGSGRRGAGGDRTGALCRRSAEKDRGKMLAIMGTSTCHMMMGTTETQVPGICGVVEDGILPAD